VVHESRTGLSHRLVRLVLHQSRFHTNRCEQQSMVKPRHKPKLDLLQQVAQFVTKE
jgi:hypothetical protein